MVWGDVEDGRRLGGQRAQPVQLMRGQLDGQHVVRVGVHHDLAERRPTFPTAAVSARPPAACLEHLHGRRLAVRARDGTARGRCAPGRAVARRARRRPRREGHVRPRPAEQTGASAAARRGDDEIGVGRQGDARARSEPDVDAEDLQQGGLVDGLVLASSSTMTGAPSCCRASAAANPDTPSPATSAWRWSHGEARSAPRQPARSRAVTCAHTPDDPLGVEDPEPGRHADAADDPEPDHDRHLGPAEELEMMVQRRHPEKPSSLRSA